MPRTHAQPHAYERSSGAAAAPLPAGYRPRQPQATAYYRVIAEHLETMLQDARNRASHGFGLPRYVEQSFRRFLDCGIVEHGFARVQCVTCRYEVLVPFSCKIRGLCPSCEGRRMADGAAHLVEVNAMICPCVPRTEGDESTIRSMVLPLKLANGSQPSWYQPAAIRPSRGCSCV